MFDIPENTATKGAACATLTEGAKRKFFQGQSYDWAKKVCRQCPVKQACLAAALDLEHEPGNTRRYGVWGGMTPDERNEAYGTPLQVQQANLLPTGTDGGYVQTSLCLVGEGEWDSDWQG